MIELNHFSPRPVDDSFSISLFNKMIKGVDPGSRLFTDAEYKTLSASRLQLDDELKGKGWAFFDQFVLLYKKALARADSLINKLTQIPFDFSIDEYVTSSKEETFNFAKDLPALANRWSRHLKYMALDQLYDIMDEDSTGETIFKNVISSNEAKVRERIKITELRSLKKITNDPAGFENYVAALYLDALASGFDPHTNYFSPQGKEEFQAELSSEALSFGLDLDENEKGKIIVERLTPGGPAWKNGDLNKGDELLSLQWEGKQAVEMTGSTIEEAYEVLEQSSNDRLAFKFQKTDGTVRTIFLRKEKIENEENIVKGFVLKGEKKIGYILLPGFYTEWENESGSSCANDVAKEIVKLKKENIDGLILDVRFNGGGSVREAIEMAGIFIDEGPLAGEKIKPGKLVFLKDPNRGTIYNGPLVLMVNGQSASASEMLAASLQDYKRALIVGSNTYGKATMQQMFTLDTFSKKPSPGSNGKDMVKITIGKIFRLNGETAQLAGVKPDILLPDAFDGIDYREKFSPAVLPAEAAERNGYYQPLAPLPVSELKKRSEERVNNNIEFQGIKKAIDLIRAQRERTLTISLKWDSFEKWERQNNLAFEMINDHTETRKKSFIADNHSLDKALLINNDYAQELNKAWLKNISEDIYIQEAFSILCDLNDLQKNQR